MTNKLPLTIESLQAEIDRLQRENAEKDQTIQQLSVDPSYEILTRPALSLKLQQTDNARFLIFIDIDDLFIVNDRISHDEANRKIAAALKIRSTDVLLSGRWYSGDELVIILSGSPAVVCRRLKKSFQDQGLSITCAWVEFNGDLVACVKAAKAKVDAAKPGTIEEKIAKRQAVKRNRGQYE